MASEIERQRTQAQQLDRLKRAVIKVIKDAREDAELSHKQVANHLGLQPWQVVNMERGRRAVRASDLALLEESFGLKPGKLLEDIRRVYEDQRPNDG